MGLSQKSLKLSIISQYKIEEINLFFIYFISSIFKTFSFFFIYYLTLILKT